MTPRSFQVTEMDVAELHEAYGDEGSGHGWLGICEVSAVKDWSSHNIVSPEW
jgi:hypothetical protein